MYVSHKTPGNTHALTITLDRDLESKLWYIVDRKKELIKVRGYQVSPSEIEGVLLDHPEIIDAAVIGVPARNVSNGEAPRAYLTLCSDSSLTIHQVHELIETRLARYKQCTGGVVIGAEIPKSMSGKILKRILVQKAEQEMATETRQSKI